MRGLVLAILVCLALCIHCTTSQWNQDVLYKGKTCEDLCKTSKKCDPLNEFANCKCFPRHLVSKWLRFNSLPIDPHEICRNSWTEQVPKCCDFYKKQEDDRNNDAEQLKMELKRKLSSYGQNPSSSLNAEILNLLVDQLYTSDKENDDEIRQLEKRVSNLADELHGMLGAHNGSKSQMVEQLAVSCRCQTARVGFMAYLDHIERVRYGDTLVFNQVLTSGLGVGYNSKTGVFTCPNGRAGAYVFSFSVGVRREQSISALLLINDVARLTAYAVAAPRLYSQSSSTTALVQLNSGDNVKVVHNPAHRNGLGYADVQGSDTLRITSFSGFRLYS